MQTKNSAKSRTLDNIDFLVSIGEFKLRLSLPKNTTVSGLIAIVRGYDALHDEYGPQGQHFMGLAALHTNALLDYWLSQSAFDFMRFRKRLEVKSIYSIQRRSEKLSANEFQYLVCLGKGAWGEVYLVRSKISGSVFAMKRVSKDKIRDYNSLMTQFRQRKNLILLGLNSHTVTLHATFQSKGHFNFVMDYCPGGELFVHLSQKNRKLNISQIKYYFCEILLAMEYIHRKKVLYRDLKPENIFVDINGHLKIGDFGLSKCDFQEDDFAVSVCGSQQYMAPQILENKDYNFSADFYSIGTLLYELLTGFPPYYSQEEQKVKLMHMKNMDLQLDRVTDDPLLQQLLVNLLHPDPQQRISNFQQIKNSPWLSKIDWKIVESKSQILPLAPQPSNIYIGKEFLNLQREVDDMNLSYEDDNFSSQISDAFEYVRQESKKLLGLDDTPQFKILKQKSSHRMEKKPTIKKTNLSVALFDKEDHSSIQSCCSQIRTSKHADGKENKEVCQRSALRRDASKKTFVKPNQMLMLNNKTMIPGSSIVLRPQKSQRNLITNSHNSSECSLKSNSKQKDLTSRLQMGKSKGCSKQKSMKQTSIPKTFKKKEQKKMVLPTCSFKIKLT